MSELELKIEKLIKDQILITESEAQDLATLICGLPEINGGRVGAEVIVKLAELIEHHKREASEPFLTLTSMRKTIGLKGALTLHNYTKAMKKKHLEWVKILSKFSE